jgi:fermentation-respiration switch protein FrsA (DUF1100 family)
MRKATLRNRVRVTAIVTLCAAGLFPFIDRLTYHAGETVILLMPWVLGAMLWSGWPAVRRLSVFAYLIYVTVIVAAVAGAEMLAANVAGGRVLWMEVFWAVYLVIAWRLGWAVYAKTVGMTGERLRRWGRRTRRLAGGIRKIDDSKRRRLATVSMFIGPARFALVLFLFVPLAFGSLIHRLKIGNPTDLGRLADLPIEDVTFETADGITLSGWFLPDEGSDSTVVVCHGSGANKGNFAEYLALFHGQGSSSLIFDFRGHGASDGHTSTFGLFEVADVRAAVDWLKRERPERSQHVFGIGSSMGAMALVRAAADDERIEAIVLDSCFASVPTLAAHHTGRVPVVGPLYGNLILASMSLHAGALLWEVNGLEVIAKIAPRPVFLIHGRYDIMIPPEQMEQLYEAAGEPKQKWLGPGLHSNIMSADYHGYQRRVVEFFQDAEAQVQNRRAIPGQ